MIENHLPATESPFLILCAIVLFYALSRYAAGGRLQLFLRSFTNANLVEQQVRQERSFAGTALFSFVTVMLILAAFFASVFPSLGLLSDFSFAGRFVSLLIGLLLLTTFRAGVYAFISWLLDQNQLHQYHSFHWLLSNYILSLILLPTTVFIVFGPSELTEALVTLGMWLVAAFYLFRIVRFSLLSTIEFRAPIGYNFLYICALEISPLMLVISVISRQIAS